MLRHCLIVAAWAAGLVALVACGIGAKPQIHFPQHQQPPLTNWGTDYIFGELILVDGCLRLSYTDPTYKDSTPDGVLIIWPAGFRLNRDTTPARIINPTGLVAARVGDDVRISGDWSKDPRPTWWPAQPTRAGMVRDEAPDTATLAKELPAECTGPYWIVGDEVSALGPDEPLEISPPDSTIYFPRQKTLRGPVAHLDAETVGRLVLDGDCLRLQDEAVPRPYSVVVWPPGFSPHIERGEVEIRNGGGRTIARVGDELMLGGGVGSLGVLWNDGRCSPGPAWETAGIENASVGGPD